MSTISAITYRDGKILKQETVSEPLDYDPSEGQDWYWEDYECLGRGLSGLTNQGETCSCGEKKAGSKRTRSHLLVIRSAESRVNSGEFTQMFVCL